MAKLTKNTLKKYARKGQLMHVIHQEFDGMIDGKSKTEKKGITTLKDLDNFFVSRNFLEMIDSKTFKLSNCVYSITFKLI